MHHVYSHDQAPLDELVDHLCSRVKADWNAQVCGLPVFSDVAVQCSGLQIADVIMANPSQYLADPTRELQLPSSIVGECIDGSALSVSPDAGYAKVRAVTASVGTLKERAKRGFVFHQLAQRCVHIAGLQETRQRASDNVACQQHTRVIGCSDRGDYGCEICVLSDSPELGQVGPQQCSVVLDQPRMLIVSVVSPKASFYAVGAHAPHSKSKECHAWWEDLGNTLQHHTPCNSVLLCFIDGNVRCSRAYGGTIGVFSPDSACSEHAQLCVDQFQHAKLWAPGTFNEVVAEPAQATHTTHCDHASGNEPRIDYIMASECVSCLPGSYLTYEDFELLNEVTDHSVVQGDSWLPRCLSVAPVARRKCKYDPGSFQRFLQALCFCAGSSLHCLCVRRR